MPDAAGRVLVDEVVTAYVANETRLLVDRVSVCDELFSRPSERTPGMVLIVSPSADPMYRTKTRTALRMASRRRQPA